MQPSEQGIPGIRVPGNTGAAIVPEVLCALLTDMESVAVAFSGGVDSTFLLWACTECLGADHVLAVTGDSPTIPRRELDDARDLAAKLGVHHLVVETRELHSPAFTANPPDRCFHCKDELFARIRETVEGQNIRWILDGTNADDLQGHRPGARAAKAHDVRSPLAEAGLGKEAVRELSRKAGLPTWDKPQMACLASRLPHGEEISREKLSKVELAEEFLRDLGFCNIRVRAHGDLARIEVDADHIEGISRQRREKIAATLKELGFRYVTLDLEGFRSGSLSP